MSTQPTGALMYADRKYLVMHVQDAILDGIALTDNSNSTMYLPLQANTQCIIVSTIIGCKKLVMQATQSGAVP